MKFNVLSNMDSIDSKAKLYFIYRDKETLFNDLDSSLKEKMEYIFNHGGFKGKSQEVHILDIFHKEKPKQIIALGLGDKEDLDLEKIRRTTGKAIELCNKKGISKLHIPLLNYQEDNFMDTIKTITEIGLLSNYSYDKYLSKKHKNSLEEINFIVDEKAMEEIKEAINEGIILGETVNIARDLVNEPANKQTPEQLAKDMKKIGELYEFEVEIIEEENIRKLGMDSFLQVSKGSVHPPKLVVMRYFGDKENKDISGLVGKAITYDSGGISLKSNNAMINMKQDMSGSASVVGAMAAIAKQKLKVNVVGVAGICENMISNTALKPGDVIDSMAGKTIVVQSTDSEGRLTLIDTIHYAIEKEKATRIVDIASLTGASQRFLGKYATGVMCNDDEYYEQLEKASKESGEMVWRFPIFEDCRELLKGDVADLNNSTRKQTCGAITAAMFIQEFVQDMPWIHMDIAGTAWFDSPSYYNPKGGTGVGVRTLYYLLKNSQ